jgi:hypothetical protein
MVDEITRASMIAIIARWQLAHFSQEIQKAIRDEAQNRMAEFGKVIMECKNTAKSLGFNRDDDEAWKAAIAEFVPAAQELYTKAKPPELPDWDWAIKDKLLARPEPVKEASQAAPPPPPRYARPSIRQIVLDRLEQAGGVGAKAIEIRKYIEATYSEEIHEKTVGMTLYRLLQDELVRRQGHTWFFVPQTNAETKNPGGETPGPNNLFS